MAGGSEEKRPEETIADHAKARGWKIITLGSVGPSTKGGPQAHVTIAVGVARDSASTRKALLASSEKGRYLRAPVRALVSADEIVVGGVGHPEEKIVGYVNTKGWKLLVVTSGGRPTCRRCAEEIRKAGAVLGKPGG